MALFAGRAGAVSAMKMQLPTAIPPLGRPETDMFDGSVPGDAGFDPLTISAWLDSRSIICPLL